MYLSAFDVEALNAIQRHSSAASDASTLSAAFLASSNIASAFSSFELDAVSLTSHEQCIRPYFRRVQHCWHQQSNCQCTWPHRDRMQHFWYRQASPYVWSVSVEFNTDIFIEKPRPAPPDQNYGAVKSTVGIFSAIRVDAIYNYSAIGVFFYFIDEIRKSFDSFHAVNMLGATRISWFHCNLPLLWYQLTASMQPPTSQKYDLFGFFRVSPSELENMTNASIESMLNRNLMAIILHGTVKPVIWDC